MVEQPNNPRKSEANVDSIFLDRWSPRAFSSKPVPKKDLASLFEAARWAPSCYNEQPWLFLYATGQQDLERFRPLLVDANRAWSDQAPVLPFMLARRNFQRNNKPNDWAVFDAGAAWMSLALQARKLGLYTHGMAGIHKDKVYEALGVPKDEYEVICGIVIGYLDDLAQLPEKMREREVPNDRKPLAEVAIEGDFGQFSKETAQ